MSQPSLLDRLLITGLLLFSSLSVAGEQPALSVAAANSTCSAVKQIGNLYTQEYGESLSYICKSSGRLAKGIRGHAIEADIYISASKKWMDYMLKHDQAVPGSVITPWGNMLVVAAPKTSPLSIDSLNDLASDKVEQVLIGDPSTAPFGRYSKDALVAAGVWDKVLPKIITRRHITLLAETLAQSGDASAGLLFSTNLSSQLRKLMEVDSSLHKPIRYYMGRTTSSKKVEQVESFLEFIQSEPAMKVAQQAGFTVFER